MVDWGASSSVYGIPEPESLQPAKGMQRQSVNAAVVVKVAQGNSIFIVNGFQQSI